jgi:hypothetical protein
MLKRLFIAGAIAFVTLVGVLIMHGDANALVVNGSCTSDEVENLECVAYGTVGTLEVVAPVPIFVPASASSPCKDPDSGQPVACTLWQYYLPSTSSTNQENFLVPAFFKMLRPPGRSDLGSCSQLYAPGAGDPTTGFGAGMLAFQTCRIAPTSPVGTVPNTIIATTPALPGAMLTQLKSGKSTFLGFILGPLTPGVPQLATTTDVITALGNGNMLTVQLNQDGSIRNATDTLGTAALIPDGGMVLCSTTDLTAIANFSNTSSVPVPPWTCDQIVFNDGKNVQAGGNSTCYYRTATGSYLKYSC